MPSRGRPPLTQPMKPWRTAAAKAKLTREASGVKDNGASRKEDSIPNSLVTPPRGPMAQVKVNTRLKDERSSENSSFPQILQSNPSLNAVKAPWTQRSLSQPNLQKDTSIHEHQTHSPGPLRWENPQYLPTTNEIEIFVELLNALGASRAPFLGNTLFIPDSTAAETAEALSKLNWSIKDDNIWVSVNFHLFGGVPHLPITLRLNCTRRTFLKSHTAGIYGTPSNTSFFSTLTTRTQATTGRLSDMTFKQAYPRRLLLSIHWKVYSTTRLGIIM